MNLIKELDNNDRMGGTGGQAYYPTLSKARVLKLISSAREELLNAIDKQESPLWIMDDFGEPTRINTIYLKIKINSVFRY